MRRVLPPIGFAVVQRGRLCHRVGDTEPFDAVDLDHLAARGPARRFLPRHVVGVLDVDDAVPRFELLLDEFEGSRADHFGHLLERIRTGEALRHDKKCKARRLGEPVEQERKRLFQLDREALVAVGFHLVDNRLQRLTEPVPRHPAVDRGDAIGAAHRASIMKGKPIAAI
jgi:hypothetical protein